jgi:hypothetical protein
LAKAGHPILVQLGVSSRMTDRLLAALVDHTQVAERADLLVDRTKHPDPVALVELGLPLVAGEQISWGKVEQVDVAPLASDHPSEIGRSYIRTIWRPESVYAAALRDWALMPMWAAEYAADRLGEEASVSTEAAPADAGDDWLE